MSTVPGRRVVPPPATAPLVARTVPVADPGSLIHQLSPDNPLAWLRWGEGLVAWGECARIGVGGRSRFEDADEAWRTMADSAVVRDEVQLPGTGPVAFASFAFSDRSSDGGVLIVPRVVLGRRGDTCWLTTMSPDGGIPPVHRLGRQVGTTPPGDVSYADGARSRPEWTSVVAGAVDRIVRGAVDKVVLARDLHARASRPVDVRWLLERLVDRYPSCWTFTVDGLVGATPELLLRRERGLVTSRILAGTIRRTGDDEHDLALAASLARSSKDLEEHEYAVRSVAEALAPHWSSGNVPESPFVLHLPNVMHLATDVTGVLRSGGTGGPPSAIGLTAALHPTAAVCGTPTEAAADLIAELEGMDRGRYAGPVGWIDASGDGEFGIALRCAQVDPQRPERLRLFAGCGIVAGSNPADELAESDAKLVPMRDALS